MNLPDAGRGEHPLGGSAPLVDEHLRAALAATGLGTWRWERASGESAWDDQMEALYGFERGEFDGSVDAWVDRLHPEDRDRVLAALEALVASDGTYRVEHRIVLPSGDVRWIEAAGDVTRDARGEVDGAIGCAADVTDRALAAIEVARFAGEMADLVDRERLQRTRLELVAAVNHALDTADDLDALLASVGQVIVRRLGDWCTLFVLEGDDPMPRMATSHADPATADAVAAFQAQFPYDPDSPVWVPQVIRSGTSTFHPELSIAVERAQGRPDEADAALGTLHLASAMAVPLLKGDRALGAIELVMSDEHRRYTDEDLVLVEAIAARIATTLDNRRLSELRDRTARMDAELADLGRRLVEAATVERVIGVALATAPILEADSVEVLVVTDPEHLDVWPAGGVPGDVRRVTVAEGVTDAPGLEEVLREGERSFTRTGGEPHRAVLLSPLLDDERCTVAVLVFRWVDDRSFDEVDRTAIETLTRLCGQALRRAQIGVETEQLATIAASLSSARSATDIARQLQAHGEVVLGATVTNLRRVDAATHSLVAVAQMALPPAVAQRYERLDLDAPTPPSDSARTNEAIWLDDRDQYRAAYPDLTADVIASGVSAAAGVPLHDSDGEVIGVVTFGWPTSMHFGQRFRARLATLCELAAQTLERVLLYESEHAVVLALQRQLLPALPDHGDLEVAAFYEPATIAVGMGGDWYQAFHRDDGSLVAIVGDVVGHGVEAIASMSRLQNLLTGLVRTGTPLEDLFATLNDIVSGPTGTYATAVLLHVDPHHGRLGYQLAGHPPPIVRLPDGSTQALDAQRQPMLGMSLDLVEGSVQPERRALEYVDLPPGALVVAYTDGLIERRGESLDAGIERLERHLARTEFGTDLRESLTSVVDELRLAEGADGNTVDDVAALVIRRR